MIDERLIRKIRDQVAIRFDYSQSMTDEELLDFIEDAVFREDREQPIPASLKAAFVKRLFHSFRGLDVLQPLMDDPKVTEIMVNGYDEIFFERGGVISAYGEHFESEAKLEDLIQTIVSKVNRTVNESRPIVDARWKDGSRVHVVLPPIALKGPTLTIRKFPEKPMIMDELIQRQSLTKEAADYLSALVRGRFNVFVSGGTGSGKTTFLNALSGFIPKEERIVTIEDSAELQIKQVPNLVALETRNVNTEGKGEISMRDLIRASLRMRPDRIIVGEVRGAEAMDMLQAMNTGHNGSLSTGHANSAKDMIRRLETMVLMAAPLPVEAIRKHIESALDVIIHLVRMKDGSRRVSEINEVVGIKDGEIELHPLYRFIFEEEGNGETAMKGQLTLVGNPQRTSGIKT